MSKADQTKQFIIEQSAQVFNTKGIAGTAMSDVMKATKMAKGGVYGNFESKEVLAEAVVDYNLRRLAGALTAAVGKADTARAKLYAYLDFFKEPVSFIIPGGCPILNMGVEADDLLPEIKQKVKGLIEAAQAKAAGIIREGVKNGEFKKDFDGREFSILMFSAIEGGVLIGRVLHTNSQMAVVIKMLKRMIESQRL